MISVRTHVFAVQCVAPSYISILSKPIAIIAWTCNLWLLSPVQPMYNQDCTFEAPPYRSPQRLGAHPFDACGVGARWLWFPVWFAVGLFGLRGAKGGGHERDCIPIPIPSESI